MDKLKVNYIDLASLKARTTNPRTHSKKQLRQIAESIKAFGFTNPILIDGKDEIIAGHGRLEAAKLIGLEQVPTICLEDLTEEQIRAYVIADNRLAELAGWDRNILAIEFKDLCDLDLDMDLTITGFEIPEIDLLIGELEPDDETEEEIPEVVAEAAVTQPGDIWTIGKHRLICGDALEANTYESLLESQKAQMVFTDPPYNVPIDGHVCGLGQTKHQDFAMAVGEMSSEAFTAFLAKVFDHLTSFTRQGAIHFICMDWRHMGEVIAAGKDHYSELKNLCVWAKTNGGMGSLYRSQHELVFVYKAGKGAHINNVELGKYGRNRTNVWNYPGISSFGATREEDLKAHPTVKPVKMVADAILDCSKRTGIVLDAFAGSGSTLLAAHKMGRRGYGIELDPTYCDVIVKRLTSETGLDAVHEQSGQTFAEIEQRRRRVDVTPSKDHSKEEGTL